MSLDFVHSVEIERPAEAVFDYLSEFEHNPIWQGGMRTCTWTSAERRIVGSTYAQEARFMGRRIETHFRITEFEPFDANRGAARISIESTKSTFPIQVTRSVEALAVDRTLVKAHIRGQPTGLLKLFTGMVRKSVGKDYAKLKRLLEA